MCKREKVFFFVANFKLPCMLISIAIYVCMCMYKCSQLAFCLFELIKYSNGKFCEFENGYITLRQKHVECYLITIPISQEYMYYMAMLCSIISYCVVSQFCCCCCLE